MAKFTSLEIENTMAVKVAEIKPNGEPITSIGGKTAQGKSTVLRAVEMLLDGAKVVPDEPLRRGTRKGYIRGEIDGGSDNGGLTVERKITRRGTSLVVTGKEGTPQALMDQIKGGCTQDLGKIARMKNAELLAVVRELVPGQDFTAHDVKREGIYKARADTNRDVKRIKAQLDAATHHDDAPLGEVSVAELTAELQQRSDENTAQEIKRRELRRVADTYRATQGDVRKAEEDLVRAEKELAGAKVLLGEISKKGQALKVEVGKFIVPNLEEIHNQLSSADDANRKTRDNQAHAKLTKEHEAAEVIAKKLNRQLENLDEKKAKAIAEAEYPVVGLSVDDDIVKLYDFAWDQASMREKLVASAEIVLAQSPELRELLLDEGSAFDQESRAALGEWADANDAHVWMIVVGDGRGCSIVFHEGEIVEVDDEGSVIAPPTPPAKPEKTTPEPKQPEVIDVDFGGGGEVQP